jgi:hypothetical protein
MQEITIKLVLEQCVAIRQVYEDVRHPLWIDAVCTRHILHFVLDNYEKEMTIEGRMAFQRIYSQNELKERTYSSWRKRERSRE